MPSPKIHSELHAMDYELALITFLDLLGTAVFAATGAMKGVEKHLDIFGICVLACCVGCGGGMIRDALLGAVPAASLTDWRYLTLCCAVAILVFRTSRYWSRIENVLLIWDAVGLGVFTALGAIKGLDCGAGKTGVVLTGVLTACGGGLIRDLLVREVPTILYRDFYATAALLGGILFLLIHSIHIHWFLNFIITGCFVIILRLIAMKFHFHLPMPRSSKKNDYHRLT